MAWQLLREQLCLALEVCFIPFTPKFSLKDDFLSGCWWSAGNTPGHEARAGTTGPSPPCFALHVSRTVLRTVLRTVAIPRSLSIATTREHLGTSFSSLVSHRWSKTLGRSPCSLAFSRWCPDTPTGVFVSLSLSGCLSEEAAPLHIRWAVQSASCTVLQVPPTPLAAGAS